MGYERDQIPRDVLDFMRVTRARLEASEQYLIAALGACKVRHSFALDRIELDAVEPAVAKNASRRRSQTRSTVYLAVIGVEEKLPRQ